MSLFVWGCAGITSAATNHGVAGQYRDPQGGVHDVEVWSSLNSFDGLTRDYFLLTNPTVGTGPFPVIVFNNPYMVVPSPPSTNAADIFWTSYTQSPGAKYDMSLPHIYEEARCTANYPGTILGPEGQCPLNALLVTNLDLHFLGDESVSKADSNVDWALTNGYAVAIAFSRFYSGRNYGSMVFGVEDILRALKNMPERIDPNKVGITGRSLGGFLSVTALSSNRATPVTIAAAVPEVAAVDLRRMHYYAYTQVPNLITRADYREQARNFSNNYANRVYAAIGTNTSSALWGEWTNPSIAQRFNTPILQLDGTDDAMTNYEHVVDFHSELLAAGKRSTLWIYQNGTPPWSTQSLTQISHGILDRDSRVKRRFLLRNHFLQYMPPNIPEVVYRHPAELNLVGMFTEFRERVCSVPDEKQNVSNLMINAANPILTYMSTDVTIPNNSNGPAAAAAAINYVWRNEGIHWAADNVIENLQSGHLPDACDPNPDITPPTIPTGLTAAAVSTSQINLSWSSSNDPIVAGAITSGLQGYRIFRSGRQIATVTTGTTFSDTGLAANTAYSYTVLAYDVAGNASVQSNAVSATTHRLAGLHFTQNPLIVMNDDAETGAATAVASDDYPGAGPITYRWTLETGPGAITVSPDNSPTANNTTITFTRADTYVLRCTITNNLGTDYRFSNSVVINQNVSEIRVCPEGVPDCPTSITLNTLQNQRFLATGVDQFGDVMILPTITWSVTGVGSINSAGIFNASQIGPQVTVTAESQGRRGSINVTLVSYNVSTAYASPVPYKASQGLGVITFRNLGSQATIRIFTTSGRRVFETQVNASDFYEWDVKNTSGESVASGVYFYVIESPENKKNGKLIIIQ